MRAIKLMLLGLYLAYLVHLGFLLMVVPWSEPWPRLLLQLPPHVGYLLDRPAVRGAISAFGLLHILLAIVEANPVRIERRLSCTRPEQDG